MIDSPTSGTVDTVSPLKIPIVVALGWNHALAFDLVPVAADRLVEVEVVVVREACFPQTVPHQFLCCRRSKAD